MNVLPRIAELGDFDPDPTPVGTALQRCTHGRWFLATPNHSSVPRPANNLIQTPNDTLRWQREIDINARRFPVKVVDHIEQPDTPAGAQLVMRYPRIARTSDIARNLGTVATCGATFFVAASRAPQGLPSSRRETLFKPCMVMSLPFMDNRERTPGYAASHLDDRRRYPIGGTLMSLAVIRGKYMSYHELDQKIHALLDACNFAGVGTWEWHFDSDRVRWSPSMATLFDRDVTKLDLSGPESFAAILAADIPKMRARIDTAILDRAPFSMAFRVTRADGTTRWLRSNGKAIYSTEGVATSLVGITFDDTERIGLTHQLGNALGERESLLANERAARENAERADRMKDEFLATLSHELRTPLNAVLGWAQILRLKTADGTDDVKRGLEAIERNARLQTQLIDDLLDMSRIISGKVRLDAQSVYPIASIEAAIETLLPTAATKGVRIEKSLAADAGPVSADPSRLQQVVWNLLSNAVKFTPRGGTVQVVLAVVDDSISIDVTDTGIGIEPDFISHVFERFRQADASTSRSHSGLGLGLAIVKQLVDLHGGTVRATSPGHGLGTTMSILLPRLHA